MRNVYLNARRFEPATQIHALQYHCVLIAPNMEAARFFETSVNFSRKKFTYKNFKKGFTFQNHLGTEICVISKIMGRKEVIISVRA